MQCENIPDQKLLQRKFQRLKMIDDAGRATLASTGLQPDAQQISGTRCDFNLSRLIQLLIRKTHSTEIGG
jgi:hypothetical protein